jgi:hypothetical protein
MRRRRRRHNSSDKHEAKRQMLNKPAYERDEPDYVGIKKHILHEYKKLQNNERGKIEIKVSCGITERITETYIISKDSLIVTNNLTNAATFVAHLRSEMETLDYCGLLTDYGKYKLKFEYIDSVHREAFLIGKNNVNLVSVKKVDYCEEFGATVIVTEYHKHSLLQVHKFGSSGTYSYYYAPFQKVILDVISGIEFLQENNTGKLFFEIIE